jgi:hypothetical protein
MRKIDDREYKVIRKHGKKVKPKDLKVGMEVQSDLLAWYSVADVVAVEGDFVWLEFLDAKGNVDRISLRWETRDHRGETVGHWNHNCLYAVPPKWEKDVTYRFKNHHRDGGVRFKVTAVDEDGNALAQATSNDARTYYMGLPMEDRSGYEAVTQPQDDRAE